jgi:hypothetical protein
MTRHRLKNELYTAKAGDYFDWISEGSPHSGEDYRIMLGSHREIWDENHGRDWKRQMPSGGPLDLRIQIQSRLQAQDVTIYRPNGLPGSTKGKAYSGKLTASMEPDDGLFHTTAQATAESAGATLYKQARPARPLFNTLNAFYELKDVPGMLKDQYERLLFSGPRGWAGGYLSYQFGWKPLLSDTMGFVSMHFDLKKAYEQLLRDEGKAVRRSSGFPPTEESYLKYEDVPGYNSFEQGFVTQTYASEPTRTCKVTKGQRVYFRGRFRYSLPPGPRDWQWKARILAKLYGLNPKPDVIYRAIPWTWLADWFGNFGDVLANISGGVEDNLSSDYAYVMCHKWQKTALTASGTFYSANSYESPVIPVTSTTEQWLEHKVRVPADPFGFAIKENEFSLTQHAILGALGLNKLR